MAGGDIPIIRVAGIDTDPLGGRGSMRRYAELVESMFAPTPTAVGIHLQIVSLALPRQFLCRVPGFLWGSIHHGWLSVVSKLRLSGIPADLFHVFDGSTAYVAASIKTTPVVATAHDVIPLLRFHGRFDVPPPRRSAALMIRRNLKALKRVNRILAVSANTKQDLIRPGGIPGRNIRVVHLPVPPSFSQTGTNAPPWPVRRRSHDAFILNMGNNAFYKNREGVLRIFAKLRKEFDLRLIMAGVPPLERHRRLSRRLGIEHHVKWIHNPDDHRLAELYRHACLFIYPSLYEGFGWPPLEAMAAGCPVVASNAASLPEVVGNAALTASPRAEGQLAALAAEVLNSSETAVRLIEKGWERSKRRLPERTAAGIRSVYTEVIQK